MVNGDRGGSSFWPYTTRAQRSVATTLGQQAGEIGAKFTLLLGDNFYSHGVKSVDDHRWVSTFESVFTNENLQSDRHFRVIAGNHDHRGNVSAQIAYSSKSPRWFFPSEYYDFVEGISGVGGNLAIHFVMIDTSILIKDTPESQRQWAWLRKVLAGSSADFLVVAGHHPVWSSCSHGPTQKLVGELKALLDAARASIYLSGHDHCAEHIGENMGVQYHVIGAGAGFSSTGRSTIPEGLSKWLYAPFAPWTGAFAQVVVDAGHGLVLTHFDSNGQVLYVAPAIPRRQESLIIS
jgi:tartrate-resistant acid phosphatase type 5